MNKPPTRDRAIAIETERRRTFSESTERYALKKINALRTAAIESVRPVETSHVNFVYTASMEGEPVIVKFNLFGRSMLYAYEQFQAMGKERFEELLDNYSEQDDQFEIRREIGNLDFLRNNGVRVPDIKLFVPPNIAVYERVAGPTIDETIRTETISVGDAHALAKTLLRIHQIKPALNARRVAAEASEGSVAIQDDNFNDVILINDVHPKAIPLFTEGATTLMHGDFKPNNVLMEKNGPCIIDPRLQVGPPEADIGKFVVRGFASSQASQRSDSSAAFAHSLVEAYCTLAGMDREHLEHRALAWGLTESHHLLSKPLRKNIDLLGSEMSELAAIRNTIDRLFNQAVHEGKRVGIDDLYNKSGQ